MTGGPCGRPRHSQSPCTTSPPVRHTTSSTESSPATPTHRGAVAAVGLEQHHDALHRLDHDGQQTVLADVVRLTVALTHCEDDLLRRCPTDTAASRRLANRAGLLGLRADAERLYDHATTGQSRPLSVDVAHVQPDRPLFVRDATTIPTALDRLQHLWATAPEIAVRDIVLTGNCLQQAATSAVRALRRTSGPTPAAAMGQHESDLVRDLARLVAHRRHLASVTAVPTGIERQCRALGAVTRPGGPPLDSPVAWEVLDRLPALTDTVAQGVEHATRSGQFLVAPEHDDHRPVAEVARWLPPANSDDHRLGRLRADAHCVHQSVAQLAKASERFAPRGEQQAHRHAARSIDSIKDLHAHLVQREAPRWTRSL